MTRDIGTIHRQGGDTPLINIVLFEPEIPQNTGAIGRLCVCLNASLHLIKPLGFELDATKIKRAGLDYWPYLKLTVHENWDAFLASEAPKSICFITTKTNKTYFEHDFSEDEYLVFGRETRGLPEDFYDTYDSQLLTIPMPGEHARSQNLANSVSIVGYEALRQLRYD